MEAVRSRNALLKQFAPDPVLLESFSEQLVKLGNELIRHRRELIPKLSPLARLAYRRPVTKRDVDTLLQFFDQGRKDRGSFDHGIQFALERMLVDPDFLLRIHRDPVQLEVASRLSFFLWSSIPDDRLLSLAERGELTLPDVLHVSYGAVVLGVVAMALASFVAASWWERRRSSLS